MGIAVSRYSDLTNNELLVRFCSTEVLCPNEPFWNQLLAFNINPPDTSEEQLMFDSSTEPLLQKFLVNNPQTGNLGSLVQVFITRATELLASPSTDNAMLAWQTFNALFVIRAVIKYLVEIVPEYQLGQHLDVEADRRRPPDVELEDSQTPEEAPTDNILPEEQPETKDNKIVNNESRLEMLCDALVGLICDVTVTDNTYYLHVECINTYLVLMSAYMFAAVHGQARMSDVSYVYRTIFQGRYSLHAPLLVRTLVNNVSGMRRAPEHRFNCQPGQGSLVINIASGLWNILTFSSSATRHTIHTQPPVDRTELTERLLNEHPLANQSCLLILALTNHCMNEDNLYRRALFTCEDASVETSSTTPKKDNHTTQVAPPRIEMAALHKTLCATASCEHFTLLLYLMLHSCRAYKAHVLAHPNIDTLILPILQCLYNAPESTSHHIYMSLIVLLILTEDDNLTKTVHQISIKNPVWYTERALTEISLGGLMVLVIIRTVQYNIVRVRDKYLHTNCLAAIANMSSEFRNLHQYVAQRLVSLYETLSKRRARLFIEHEGDLHQMVNGAGLPKYSEERDEEIWEHICVLDEVLRMLLEILNSCLSNQLQNNLNLVYALLHKKQLFMNSEQPVMNNIEMVIGYFSSRLQRVQEGAGGDLGVTEVLACIRKGAEQWSNDRLKKFPELKFRYVEEDSPEEFFTPYVWALALSCGIVHWASEGGAKCLRDLATAV